MTEIWRGITVVENLAHGDMFKAGGQWHFVHEMIRDDTAQTLIVIDDDGTRWTFQLDTSIAVRVLDT